MNNHDPEKEPFPAEQSPIAKGYMIGNQILATTLEMALPIILGVWADRHWGKTPLFILLGVGVGLLILMVQLIKLATINKHSK